MTGAQMRLIRERCQLTQRALARLLRLHHMTVWKLEHDRKRITRWHVMCLATLVRHARLPVRPCPTCGGTGTVERHT
jgi:transcriptional regulator with XRE-family HTH domain